MKVTRIYTGADNRSHFEELDMPLHAAAGSRRDTSNPLPAIGAAFGESAVLLPLDFHTAPRRQLVAMLSGSLEIECGDGSKRRFGPGDVFFADDTAGQGHVARDLSGPVRSLYVFVAPDADPGIWRA